MPFGSERSILSSIVSSLKPTGAKIIVATSENIENDSIAHFCQESKINYHRGSENDVFSRFKEIQEIENFDVIFRFTADNPFIDLEKLEEFYTLFSKDNLDYAYSTGMPLGMNFEIMRGSSLRKIESLELNADEKEHVTLKFKRDNRFKIKAYSIANYDCLRMTIDTPIDYAQASLIKIALGDVVNLKKIVELRDRNDWLFDMNKAIVQRNQF